MLLPAFKIVLNFGAKFSCGNDSLQNAIEIYNLFSYEDEENNYSGSKLKNDHANNLPENIDSEFKSDQKSKRTSENNLKYFRKYFIEDPFRVIEELIQSVSSIKYKSGNETEIKCFIKII